MDASTTTKLVAILRLPEDLLEKIGDKEGMIPFTSGYQLSRLNDVPTIRDLADKIMKGLLDRDHLEGAVIAILGGKKQKQAKPQKFTCGSVAGTIKGNVLDGLRALHAKLTEVLKRVERDPALSDLAASLLKG